MTPTEQAARWLADVRRFIPTHDGLDDPDEVQFNGPGGWIRTSDALAAIARHLAPDDLQARVWPWMLACFGEEVSRDKEERGDRLLEEVFELLQSGGYDPARVLALRDYVWSRDVGEPAQEVGGVMITLAAYCLAHDLNMHEAGETELARIWTKVEKIRAKQASKPKGSAFPQAWPTAPGDDLVERAAAALEGVTEGPWLIGNLESYEGDTGIAFRRVYFPTTAEDEVQEAHVRGDNCEANARFIAFARDWVPEAAARISALTATVGGLEKKLDRRTEMHECAMSERDDATLYADEHKARAEAAEREVATLRDRLARMEGALRDAKENGLIYWEPQNERGYHNKQLMLTRIDAALTDGGSNG